MWFENSFSCKEFGGSSSELLKVMVIFLYVLHWKKVLETQVLNLNKECEVIWDLESCH